MTSQNVRRVIYILCIRVLLSFLGPGLLAQGSYVDFSRYHVFLNWVIGQWVPASFDLLVAEVVARGLCLDETALVGLLDWLLGVEVGVTGFALSGEVVRLDVEGRL